jgi:hypothetical protein
MDMTVVAKMNGKLVEIVRTAYSVPFSQERGWILICSDFQQAERKKSIFRWVPASTRFEWVREFNFGE